jgi:uncharacterized membrane protein YhaH (DUF805 family)
MSFDDFCLSFTGRINRAGFALYIVVGGGIQIILIAIALVLNALHGCYVTVPILTFLLPLFYINCAVMVKRLHDINQSGRMLVYALIPFVVAFITFPFFDLANLEITKRDIATQSGRVCCKSIIMPIGFMIGFTLPLVLFFCCLFLKGTDGKNRYGDNPL